MNLTDKDLENFPQGKLVIKFGAAWCQPCRQLQPLFHDVSDEIEGIEFAAVDVDEDNGLTALFGIRNVPTVVAVLNGEVVDKVTGMMSKQKLQEFILNSF